MLTVNLTWSITGGSQTLTNTIDKMRFNTQLKRSQARMQNATSRRREKNDRPKTFINKKPSWADRTIYIRMLSNFGCGKKAISQSGCSLTHAVVTLLYRTLQSTIQYNTVIRTRDGCRHKRSILNCGQTA